MTVPIVPGPSGPYALPTVIPAKPKRSKWPWIIGVILLPLAVVVWTGVFLYLRDGSVAGIGQSDLRAAYEQCGKTGQLADGDKTLFLDLPGKSGGSSTADLAGLECVLGQLEAPSYVKISMSRTRALDGQVSETWGNFKATWTYHPDDGLDVVIRQV